MITVGWVGNYRRIDKRFDAAFHVCDQYGYKLKVAGFLKTFLHVPHTEMTAFYRGVDLILVTSIVEAHPLIVYEALACETPVAMMRVGDCAAENLPGIYYYKHLDPAVISQCIETVYKKRVAMGQEGRREIVKRWQWKNWIPRYTEMFKSVSGKGTGIRLAMVIDKPGWAWDIMCNIIKKELIKTGIYGAIDIYYHKGVDKKMVPHINCFNPAGYDVILNHYWQSYNHRNHQSFSPHKTIPCANGAAYKDRQWGKLFDEIVEKAPAITSVSRVIVDDLKSKFSVPIYHCSRGVDTDQFKP